MLSDNDLKELREEIIQSDISGADLRIVLDILNKYIDKPHLTESFTYELPFSNSACDGCVNNPKNGGSGICNCIIGSMTMW